MQQHSILAAKSLGLKVIVTDQSANAPSVKLADTFIQCSGNDTQKLLEIALEINKQNALIGAYSSSDFGLIPVATIHAALQLPGCSEAATNIALNKFESKQCWLKKGVSTPNAFSIKTLEKTTLSEVEYPIIIKPKDACGSQGITSANNTQEAEHAIHHAFKYSDEVLVEEYIGGKHYDTIGLMWQGQFIPMGIGNRFFSEPPHHFPLWGHVPSDLTNSLEQSAFNITANAAIAIGLDFTPIKADLIFAKGKFYMIEIAPRFHGDVFTSKLIPLSGIQSPIKALFEHRLNPNNIQPFNHQAHQKVLWKALFPKQLENHQQQLEQPAFTDLFLNHKKAKIDHKDNTSLIGFIWDTVPENCTFAAHYSKVCKALSAFL